MANVCLRLGMNVPSFAEPVGSSGTLFTLSQFPGMLFKTVRSVAELDAVSDIRLHASENGRSGMVISKSIASRISIPTNGVSNAIRLRYMDSVSFIDGANVLGVSQDVSSMIKYSRIGEIDKTTSSTSMYPPSGASVLLKGPYNSGEMMQAMRTARAVGMRRYPSYYIQNQSMYDTQMGRNTKYMWFKKRKSEFFAEESGTPAGDFVLTHTFAVVAKADYAMVYGVQARGSVTDATFPTTNPPSNAVTRGYMSNILPLGTLGPMLAAARSGLLAGVPSDVRKYAARAYDSMANSRRSAPVTVAVVTSWDSKFNNSGNSWRPVTGIAHSVLVCGTSTGSYHPDLQEVHFTTLAPHDQDPIVVPELMLGTIPNVPNSVLQDIGGAHTMGYTARFDTRVYVPSVSVGSTFSGWEQYMAPLSFIKDFTNLKTNDVDPLYRPSLDDNDALWEIAPSLYSQYISGNAVTQYTSFVFDWYRAIESEIKSSDRKSVV